jgi:hypothetical protein
MRIEILLEAEQELDKAVAYYEEIEPGLGLRLKSEARRLIEWIAFNSEVPRVRPRGYRRVNLKIFPYYVAYLVWSDTVWVVAIAHNKKRPEYWIKKRGIG